MLDPDFINFTNVTPAAEKLYRRLYEINPDFDKLPMCDYLEYNSVPKEIIDEIAEIGFAAFGDILPVDILDRITLTDQNGTVVISSNSVSAIAKFVGLRRLSFGTLAKCAYDKTKFKDYDVTIEPYDIVVKFIRKTKELNRKEAKFAYILRKRDNAILKMSEAANDLDITISAARKRLLDNSECDEYEFIGLKTIREMKEYAKANKYKIYKEC